MAFHYNLRNNGIFGKFSLLSKAAIFSTSWITLVAFDENFSVWQSDKREINALSNISIRC